MNIYCIIVTYNGMKWIGGCLGSLRASDHSLKVIVIDNLSTDGTFDYIKQNFPEVELINAKANLGFGKANNIGLKIAIAQNADYVFLLNQDTRIEKDTITELLNVAEANKEYGILSPFHLSPANTTLERQFAEFLSYQYTDMLVSDIFFNQLKQVYPTSYIHAASWFMSISCVKKTGGFDPLFSHYGEDDDYMQRAKYFGFKLGLVPKALIVHDATYKTWEMIEWDENRNLIVAYLQLKKMGPRFRSSLLVYLKTTFDEFTTLLLFRKFKKLRFRIKVFFKVVKNMKTIRQSLCESYTEQAFL